MELLNSNYNDIYNYLLCIVELNEMEYNNLVSIYGEASVDFIIESMILKDESNLDKFSYLIEKIMLDIDFGSSCDEVCSNVGRMQLVDYLRNNLPKEQVEILLYIYGFYGEEKSLRKIGEILNMSKRDFDISKNSALTRLGCLSKTRTKEFL